MDKREIAHVLRVIARMLEIKGEEAFKVRAYERAAESIERTSLQLEELAGEGRLHEIPGIGKNLEPKVREMVLSGRSSFLEKLMTEIPKGLLEVMQVPGIGPKTARLLYDTLGVKDLEDLEKAVLNHEIQKIPGLGPRREAMIAEGLSEVKKYSGRVTLGLALPFAEHLIAAFRDKGIEGQVVGEVRRCLETVSSIDLLLAVRGDPTRALLRSGLQPFASEELLCQAWRAEDEAFVFNTSLGVRLRLYAVFPEDFGLKMFWLSGPREHLEWMVSLAVRRGYDFNPSGLFRESRKIEIPQEADLYGILGLPPIPPEVRHRLDLCELARSGERISLVDVDDIKGDLHIHTTWSDGVAGIEEMVRKARALGYKYVAITDHATRVKLINGLDPDRVLAQREEIRRISSRYPEIAVLSGVEVDILKDGSLCLPDEILSRLDIVIASIHQDIGDQRGDLAERLLRAIENPNVDVIGHPTGRLIGRRAGKSTGLEEVFEAAARRGTLMEINASPDRIDLSEDMALQAYRFGVKMIISSDAHSPEGMEDMRFGVLASAKRAGLPPAAIVNTQDLSKWFPVKRASS
ncbi:MAG TPA: PHP domain-containing protein [Firmicutes bacterium]|nr:PHP domain-containing protein [Candidatus Fermentithermobacillaceae bacterium]